MIGFALLMLTSRKPSCRYATQGVVQPTRSSLRVTHGYRVTVGATRTRSTV